MKSFHIQRVRQQELGQQAQLQHQRELIYAIENLGVVPVARYGLGQPQVSPGSKLSLHWPRLRVRHHAGYWLVTITLQG